MEITNEQLLWDSEDIDLWRAFLNTRTGSRLLPKMLEGTPGLLPSGDSNAICIRSGEVRGFQDCAKSLLNLAIHPPAEHKAEVAYPNLHDDSQWPDGEKLTPSNP